MGNCIVHCTLKRQLEFGFVLGALIQRGVLTPAGLYVCICRIQGATGARCPRARSRKARGSGFLFLWFFTDNERMELEVKVQSGVVAGYCWLLFMSVMCLCLQFAFVVLCFVCFWF